MPFLPDPILRSAFRFDRELFLLTVIICQWPSFSVHNRDTYFEDLETDVGATVYLVNAVGAIDTSVIASMFCMTTSSVP